MTDFNAKYNELLQSRKSKGESFNVVIQQLREIAEKEGASLWALFFAARLDRIKKDDQAALTKYNQILADADLSLSEKMGNDKSLLVAQTLIGKGVVFGGQCKWDLEIATYNSLLIKFGPSTELSMLELIAKALFNKGITLGQQGKPDEEIAAYDDIINRFKHSTEVSLFELVAKALFNKGITLGQQGKPDEEIAAYDDIINRFSVSTELGVLEMVAKALFNKGITLGQQGKPDEEIETYEDAINRFGRSSETSLLELAAKTLINKGLRLVRYNRLEKAIIAYDEVIDRFSKSVELNLKEQVAKALLQKGLMFRRNNRVKEAIAIYRNIVSRYGKSSKLVLLEKVASALVNQGLAFGQLGRLKAEIVAYERVIKRFSTSTASTLLERVGMALVNKGITLGHLGKWDEEIATYNEAIRLFKDSTELALLKQVFIATTNKGICFLNAKKQKRVASLYYNIGKYAKTYADLYAKETGEKYCYRWPYIEPAYQWIAEIDKSLADSQLLENEVLGKCLFSLCNLADTVREIEAEALFCGEQNKKPDAYYYHYTTIHALRSIISESPASDKPSNFLRFGNMEYVNDPAEGMALIHHCEKCKKGDEGKCDHPRLLCKFFDRQIDPVIASRMYVLCLTENGDRLDLWRLYAKDGNGLSIGIPESAFSENGQKLTRKDMPDVNRELNIAKDSKEAGKQSSQKQEHNFVSLSKPLRVMYDDESKLKACDKLMPTLSLVQSVLEELEELKLAHPDKNYKSVVAKYRSGVQGLLLDILYLFKSKEYATEKEHRILVFEPDLGEAKIDTAPIASGEPPIIYLNSEPILFRSKDYVINIGPKVPKPRLVQLELEYRLRKNQMNQNVEINISDIKYR